MRTLRDFRWFEANAQVSTSSLRAHSSLVSFSVSLSSYKIVRWVSFIMADGNEESEDGEVSFKKPLELFKQKKNSAHMYTNG